MSSSSDSHDPFELAWLAALLIAAILLGWYFAGESLTAAGLNLKKAQLWLLAQIQPSTTVHALQQAIDQSLRDPSSVSFQALVFVFDAVGRYLRGPVIALLVGLGFWLLWAHPAEGFKQRCLASISLSGLATINLAG